MNMPAPAAAVSQSQIIGAMCTNSPNALMADRAFAHNLTCLITHAEEARKALSFAQAARGQIGKPKLAIARPDANGQVQVAADVDPVQMMGHNIAVFVAEAMRALGMAATLQTLLGQVVGACPNNQQQQLATP